MTDYGFDDNFDLSYDNPSDRDKDHEKKNVFSSLMEAQPQTRNQPTSDFPDFEQHTDPFEDNPWKTNVPATAGYGGSTNITGAPQVTTAFDLLGHDFGNLRGENKNSPNKVTKPFHLDSMSLSYFEKGGAMDPEYRPEGYMGEQVLDPSHRTSDVAASKQPSNTIGYPEQGHQVAYEYPSQDYIPTDQLERKSSTQQQNAAEASSPYSMTAFAYQGRTSEDTYKQTQVQEQQQQQQYQEPQHYQTYEQEPQHYESQPQDQRESYPQAAHDDQWRNTDYSNQHAQAQVGRTSPEAFPIYQESPAKNQPEDFSYGRNTSPAAAYSAGQQDLFGGSVTGNEPYEYRTQSPAHQVGSEISATEYKVKESSPVRSNLSEDRAFLHKAPEFHYAQQTISVKPVSDNKENLSRKSTKQYESVERGSAPLQAGKSNVVNGRSPAKDDEGSGLHIKCSVHEGQHIERVCTHPKYKNKKLLCWECGMDESREVQKYRHTLVPVKDYALKKLEDFTNVRQEEIPAELRSSLGKLEKTRELLGQDLDANLDGIIQSLHEMRSQVMEKFDEIERAVVGIAKEKVSKFDANTQFFHETLHTHYPQQPVERASYNSLLDNLSQCSTEAEFNDFIDALKPHQNPHTPQVKKFLRALSHKVDTQDSVMPGPEAFKDLNKRNIRVMQMQEQVLTSLDGIKSTVTELLSTAYTVEDITKTRMIGTGGVTLDGLSSLAKFNEAADSEILRYRMHFERSFSTTEPKSITCVVNLDDELLAVGALDKTITIWNVTTGALLETLQAHDDAVSGLYGFRACAGDLKHRAPHGRSLEEDATTLLVSTGGKFDQAVLLWDISWARDHINGKKVEKRESKLVRRLEAGDNGLTALMSIGDGVTLISGNLEGKISVWNVLKGKLVGEVKHHKSAVSCLRMMRDNERYVSASWDKTVCVWKVFYKGVGDGHERKVFTGFEMERIIDASFKVTCVGASLVKKSWLVFGGSVNRVVVWDVDLGRMVKELECEGNNLSELVLVEDEVKERMVILGVCDDDDTVRGWDLDYKDSNRGLIMESYNLKNRSKIYTVKTSVNGALMQLIQDGKLKVATMNCALQKDVVSLWDLRFGSR